MDFCIQNGSKLTYVCILHNDFMLRVLLVWQMKHNSKK